MPGGSFFVQQSAFATRPASGRRCRTPELSDASETNPCGGQADANVLPREKAGAASQVTDRGVLRPWFFVLRPFLVLRPGSPEEARDFAMRTLDQGPKTDHALGTEDPGLRGLSTGLEELNRIWFVHKPKRVPNNRASPMRASRISAASTTHGRTLSRVSFLTHHFRKTPFFQRCVQSESFSLSQNIQASPRAGVGRLSELPLFGTDQSIRVVVADERCWQSARLL